MDQFSADECSVLIEALDSWINKDALSGFMGAMIGRLVPKDETAKREWEQEQKVKDQMAAAEKIERGEVATLIKAKLISIKRAAVTA